MKDSFPYRDRVIDVMEELYKFTLPCETSVDYLISPQQRRTQKKTDAQVIAAAKKALANAGRCMNVTQFPFSSPLCPRSSGDSSAQLKRVFTLPDSMTENILSQIVLGVCLGHLILNKNLSRFNFK